MNTIMVFTKKGKVIRFPLKMVPPQKRAGIGVKAIGLLEGDEVVAVKLIKAVIQK